MFKVKSMKKLFFISIFFLLSNQSFSQKLSLVLNYEPSLRIFENHITEDFYVVHGAVNRVGVTINETFAFGASYHYLQTWLNYENKIIEELDDSSGVGLFARYVFPWRVKDKRVKFYLESNLYYNDYQTFGGFFKSEKKEFGLTALTFGFEVNFLKYFYLNLGMTGYYFFTNNFFPRMRALVECRIPIIK